MTFDSFVANAYDQNWGWFALVFLGAGVAVFIGFISTLFDLQVLSGKEISIRMGACVVALVCLIAVGTSLANASYAIDHLNAKIAEDNLKKKYDIVAALWTEERTHPQNHEQIEGIKVQDKNSNILFFQYRVDKDTHEPFLLNDSNTAQVKANDLLRSKELK
jgi:hypothetical protein